LSQYPSTNVCSAFNFGPQLESNRTVAELVESLLKHTGGEWADVSNPDQPHEASKLNLAIDKAFHVLGWKPTWTFDTCVEQTALWYSAVSQGDDPIEAMDRCLRKYLDDAIAIRQSWAVSS
jgi:CDP-glucose 4,6-dehydratase